MRNGKCSIKDLSVWRSSEKCLKQVECASADALTYSQQSASSQSLSLVTEAREPNDVSLPMPFPLAQSIVIVKDLYSLMTKLDELEHRMNSVEKFTNPSSIKHELEQMKCVVNDIAQDRIAKTTATTQMAQCYASAAVNDSPPHATVTLSIAAWNCRGLSNGLPYIEHLADKHDIIVISEHWLWPFELHKLSYIHPEMVGMVNPDSN